MLKRVKNILWRFKVLMGLLLDVRCQNKSVHIRGKGDFVMCTYKDLCYTLSIRLKVINNKCFVTHQQVRVHPTAHYLAFTFTPGQLNQTQSHKSLILGLLLIVSTEHEIPYPATIQPSKTLDEHMNTFYYAG
jgi:hypothetical protein